MKRFKTLQAILEYYQNIGGQPFKSDNRISVWNGINLEYDFYEFMDGFWVLIVR